jgi:hypothetical protein
MPPLEDLVVASDFDILRAPVVPFWEPLGLRPSGLDLVSVVECSIA